MSTTATTARQRRRPSRPGQLSEMLALTKASDSVELKLTIPNHEPLR